MKQKPEEIETKSFYEIRKEYRKKSLNKHKIPGTNILVEDTREFVYDKDASLESNVRRYVSHIVDAQKREEYQKSCVPAIIPNIVQAETRTDDNNANALKNIKIKKNKGGEVMQYCYDKIDVEALSTSERKKLEHYSHKKLKLKFSQSINNFFLKKKTLNMGQISPQQEGNPFLFRLIIFIKINYSNIRNIFLAEGDSELVNYYTNVLLNGGTFEFQTLSPHTICGIIKTYLSCNYNGIIKEDICDVLFKSVSYSKSSDDLKLYVSKYLPNTFDPFIRVLILELFDMFKEIDKNSKFSKVDLRGLFFIFSPILFPKETKKDIHSINYMVKVLFLMNKMDFYMIPRGLYDKVIMYEF